MKHLILTLLLLSCSYDKGGSVSSDFRDVKQRAEVYKSLIADPYALTARCDSLTFVGHYNAAAKTVDIYRHEYPQGQWHRSTSLCTPDDSRSECSKENILAAFHNILHDTAAVRRTIEHAKNNDWNFCEGGDHPEYNHIPEFAPLLNSWLRKLDGNSLTGDADASGIPSLEGFRGNVLGSYLLLKGRVFGYLNVAEIAAAKTLINTEPTSPLYQAIYHRFTDGNQHAAIQMMTKQYFPVDSLPTANPFAWGSLKEAPLLYVWTAGVMDGI